MATILQDLNHIVRPQLYHGAMPGSACAFKRAAILAANERKVFILHDDEENATAARLRTVSLAKLFDLSNIVTYYRNAPHRAPPQPGDTEQTARMTWSGKTQSDLTKSASFIHHTVRRKGVFVAMIGLGGARRVLRLVAKEQDIQETQPDPEFSQSIGNYPITLLTPTLFTTFHVPNPKPFAEDACTPLPSISLPVNALLQRVNDIIHSGKKLYDQPVVTMEDLRAAKAARKASLVAAARQKEEDLRIWKELKRQHDNGEDVVLPEKPLSGRQIRKRQKIEQQMLELWGNDESPNDEYPPSYFDPIPVEAPIIKPPQVDRKVRLEEAHDKISNYVIAPTAEPVVPCAVNLLDEMIQWLKLDVDIVEEQEPRIDFVRGSILGKTTQGGGTSVDLCKQVVGPRGIGPILDAVAKNSHIDRFLLGNNIVGDEGAKIIADFIASESSKSVYNFYIAGNSIGPEGIREIGAALSSNETVTALWLKRNPLLPQGAKYLASMLSMNTTLQTLDLVNTGIRDEGVVAVMEALKANPASSLRHLYLGCNAEGPISGKAIGSYLKTGFSQLTSLFISSSRLGDEGVMAIAEGLKVDRKVERIGLESVRMGDVGAKALADALENHPAIVMLDLGFRKGTFDMGEKPNTITDDGLNYLGERLLGLPGARKRTTLRSLNLTSNRISKDGASQFMKTFVEDNEQLLQIRLSQTGDRRNVEVEHLIKHLVKERTHRYFDPDAALSDEERLERERVKDALDPKHIAEIYSIYRGNM